MTTWVPTEAGRHLRGRRRIHTQPEIDLRRALHALVARFRLHRAISRGCTPDLVLPRHRIAVFVDGDYWHSCPVHGRQVPFSGPNAELWKHKMQRNRQRDARSTALAEAAGWVVFLGVWECSIVQTPSALRRLSSVAYRRRQASNRRVCPPKLEKRQAKLRSSGGAAFGTGCPGAARSPTAPTEPPNSEGRLPLTLAGSRNAAHVGTLTLASDTVSAARTTAHTAIHQVREAEQMIQTQLQMRQTGSHCDVPPAGFEPALPPPESDQPRDPEGLRAP